MQRSWGRWATLTSVPFAVLLYLAVFVNGTTPSSGVSAQHAVSFFSTHRTGQQVNAFVACYAIVFAILFGAALRSCLRDRSEGDGLISLGFGGMIIYAVGGLTICGLELAAADVPGKINPAAEQALNVLQDNVFFAFLVGSAVFLLGNGLAVVATGALPRWLGWVAVGLAVIAATPVSWLVAIFALPAWSLVVTVLIFLRSVPAGDTATLARAGAERPLGFTRSCTRH